MLCSKGRLTCTADMYICSQTQAKHPSFVSICDEVACEVATNRSVVNV